MHLPCDKRDTEEELCDDMIGSAVSELASWCRAFRGGFGSLISAICPDDVARAASSRLFQAVVSGTAFPVGLASPFLFSSETLAQVSDPM